MRIWRHRGGAIGRPPGRLGRYAWPRLALLGAVAAGTLAVRCSAGRPAERSVDGVAAFLGRALGGTVEPDDFVWESSDGFLVDAFFGRPVLFLGSHDGGPRDVYRARVRMGREGRPVSVFALRNLTDTPLGDEGDLAARGHFAAFSTRTDAGVQGVTVLDLDGPAAPDGPFGRRLAADIEGWIDAASPRGLDRTEIAFGKPPATVSLELREGGLVLALGPEGVPAALGLEGAVLNPGPHDPYLAEARAIPRTIKPFKHFAMDTLREVLGTEAADLFKAMVFDVRTSYLRAARGQGSSAEVERAVLDEVARSTLSGFPPRAIAPRFKHPLEDEGVWRAPDVPWLPLPPGVTDAAEPYLLVTTIRPDAEQPFSSIRLVAMDTRQLELGIEGGFEEPSPLTGPHGRGRIPGDKRPRAVAAFNGAFQTRHGAYGMMVDRRVLLPPKPFAATIATDDLGRPHMGSWGPTETIPEAFVSLRQNLDPLVEDGVVNPRDRDGWGFPLDGGSYLTERSALCLTRSGHLVYGWGIETDADTLARALDLVDCAYAMHLDMNPGHVGFVFMAPAESPAKTALLAPEMSIAPRRYLDASPKDFFYLTLRDGRPSDHGEVLWKPDEAAQPPPAARPAVYHTSLARLGTVVDLWNFLPDRFEWRLVPGTRELAARTSGASLETRDLARALAAISLGFAERKHNPRGLVLGGIVALPVRADLGVLRAPPLPGSLSIGISVDDMEPEGDASELALLAEGGKLRSEARRLGHRQARSAACLLEDGSFIVALSTFDSPEANTTALLEAGCTRVVVLDRGRQESAFVHRAGTVTAPAAEYPDTTLYALAISEPGMGIRLP